LRNSQSKVSRQDKVVTKNDRSISKLLTESVNYKVISIRNKKLGRLRLRLG
jgi:hypothetical protein